MIRRLITVALGLAGLLGVATLLLLIHGCSTDSPAVTKVDKICAAGQYGYCLCKNGGDGTKLCNGDGTGFAPCMKKGTTECPLGEDETSTGTYIPIGDGGNVGVEESPRRTCPGEKLEVSGSAPITLVGDTTGGGSNHGAADGACAAGNNNNEEIYQLTAKEDGQLTITLTPLGFDGLIYLRSGECASDKQVACGNASKASGVAEVIRTNVLGGENYWLFVDSAGGGKGSYKLEASLKPGPFCGNGKVDPGEACDDKNKTPGDGCEPDCSAAGNPLLGNDCPGMAIAVWTQPVTVRAQTTNGFGLVFQRMAGVCGGTSTSTGANSADRVYAVTAKEAGTMTVHTSNATFDPQIYVRSDCAKEDTQITCASAATGTADEAMTFPVVAGSTYYVIVDGLVSGSGNYDITFKID